MTKLPVLFRTDTRGFVGAVTAILPTLPANPGMHVCYAHLGQHSECSREWLYGVTRRALPAEYADLLAELRDIYSDCQLVVRARMPARA